MADLADTALLLIDLQNDFLHPDGAYARSGIGVSAPELRVLPERLRPVADAVHQHGGWVIASLFTLVSARQGEPLLSASLRQRRPFLRRGDFEPGQFGHALVDALQPVDFTIETIADSAFYQTRLDWLLRRLAIRRLIVGGVFTNRGVASTVRDAQVREFAVELLADGCAALDPHVHAMHVEALRGIAVIADCESIVCDLSEADAIGSDGGSSQRA